MSDDEGVGSLLRPPRCPPEGGDLEAQRPTPLKGRRMPLALVVLNAAAVTPVTIVALYPGHSVWLTFALLACLWVVVPLGCCAVMRGSAQLLSTAWRRGLRDVHLQALLAVPASLGFFCAAATLYHFCAVPLGLDLDAMRRTLSEYGLRAEDPPPDIAATLWLSLLNPLEEEFFWRLYLFRHLHEACKRSLSLGSRHRSWQVAGGCTSILYASYHVPVVMLFSKSPLVLSFAFLGLVGLGYSLQLMLERYGLVLTVAVHAAADAAACLVVADLVWRLGIAK